MLRAGSVAWPEPFAYFPWVETFVLLGASASFGPSRVRLVGTNSLALAFVAVSILNNATMISKGLTPSVTLQLACWFVLSSIHTLHVLAGAVFTAWLGGPGLRMATADRPRWLARIEATRRYWIFVDLVWLAIVTAFYLT
jgi:heme/copper-type cytochrome/quinol oxidase subunit 3